ncbi:MAG: cytochrome c biogenesis protein ResB [Marinilabiliales bacterium]|nr:cytochrome c biogenesis protein ResB [Marinilabiliales bacterium]
MFTPAMMGVLFIVLAVAMAAATFIENDFGADAARSTVYNTRWFELLFLLLVINLAGQIVTFKLYRREKLTVMLFHAAFIVMIAGAAITRYTGYDGMMHIREGETTSLTQSSGSSLTFELSDRDGRSLASHTGAINLTGGRNSHFKRRLEAAGEEVTLTFDRYLPGAVKQVQDAPDGRPAAAFLITPDMVSSEVVVLVQGETGLIGEMSVGFGTEAEITILTNNSEFFIKSLREVRSTSMQDMQTVVYPPDTLIVLARGIVYTVGGYRIMPQKLTMSGIVVPSEEGGGRGPGGAIECTLSGAGFDRKIYLWDDSGESRSTWQGSAGKPDRTGQLRQEGPEPALQPEA